MIKDLNHCVPFYWKFVDTTASEIVLKGCDSNGQGIVDNVLVGHKSPVEL